MFQRDIIVVGASAGGLEALRTVLRALPATFSGAIFVVLHTTPASPGLVPEILRRDCALPIAHASDGDPIEHGRVYIAQPDHHLIVERGMVRATRGPRENHCRPALDPLFRSAAYAYGSRVVGVVLTGRLDDGTAGLWAIKDRGGVTVVQDPDEAASSSMPQNALRYVQIDHVVRLCELAPLLLRLLCDPAQPRGGATAPRELEIETRIAAEGNALAMGITTMGTPSPFTCPECQGVMLSLKGGGVPRFRCHTGHAYSIDSLLAAVTDGVEGRLWSAMRSIEESVLLLRHVADHSREQQDDDEAERLELKAREAELQARLVRRALMEHEISTRESAALV
jgi:two-component system, chemotaxis family, protein-glutamate methylesterase/glutaminase